MRPIPSSWTHTSARERSFACAVPRASSVARSATVVTVDPPTHAVLGTDGVRSTPRQGPPRAPILHRWSSRACRFTRGNACAAWDRKSCCSATSSSSPRSYEQPSYPSDSAEAVARAQIERALASDRHALMSRARALARSSCSCSAAECRDRRAREEHVHRGLGTNARAKI